MKKTEPIQHQELTAVHEAGHFCTWYFLGGKGCKLSNQVKPIFEIDPARNILMIPLGRILGSTILKVKSGEIPPAVEKSFAAHGEKFARSLLVCTVAGVVSTNMIFGTTDSLSHKDLVQAQALAKYLNPTSPETELEKAHSIAAGMLDAGLLFSVRLVADELLARGEIIGADNMDALWQKFRPRTEEQIPFPQPGN
jgi:hypothetical protein